jgi:hypothetical protein
MTDKTAIERIKELDQERTSLFEHAKQEALRRANQAVEDLNALGLKYRLVEGESAAGIKGAGKKPQEKGQAEKKSAARWPG